MGAPRTGDSGGTAGLPTLAGMTTTKPPAKTPSRARTTRRALLGGGIGTLALVAGGSAWAADRYLIDHVEIDSASAYEASQGTASAATASTGGTVSGTTYTSDLATIDISTTVVGSGTDQVTYFVADVTLTDATALRSAFANDEFGREHHRGHLSAIAASVNAVFAINGDYYGFRDTGIVIRNGIGLPRRRAPARVSPSTATARSTLYDETATDADQLVEDGVWNTLSFGPATRRGRQARRRHRQTSRSTPTSATTPSRATSPARRSAWSTPTTCVFVVVDGRSPGYSARRHDDRAGADLRRPGRERRLQPRRRRVLDDGTSTATLVNDPLGRGQERGTSDILYIGA